MIQVYILTIFSLNSWWGHLWEVAWENNSWVAQVIIFIIFGLLIASSYIFLIKLKKYRKELSALEQVQSNLEKWKEDMVEQENEKKSQVGLQEDELVEAKQEIHTDYLKKDVNVNTIIFERLQTIQKSKESRAKINVEVLQNLALVQESTSWTSKFPPYVMNLALLLGMLGTFIGLTIMVGSISEQLDSFGNIQDGTTGIDSFNKSFQGIQKIMGGVSTAFTTTLMGLVCTILTSVFNYVISQKRLNYFDRLEKFTVQELLPYAAPNLEEKQAIDVIGDQLDDAYTKIIKATEENSEVIENISALYSKFEILEDKMKEILSEGGTTEVQQVVKELNFINSHLKNMIDKYQNKEMLEDFRNLVNYHQKYVGSLNGILTESQWIPRTKFFLGVIALFLFLIVVFLGVGLFIK